MQKENINPLEGLTDYFKDIGSMVRYDLVTCTSLLCVLEFEFNFKTMEIHVILVLFDFLKWFLGGAVQNMGNSPTSLNRWHENASWPQWMALPMVV